MKHLIGKTVLYNSDFYEGVGIVAAIDKNMGITIVKEDDPEENLICLHGPSAPLASYHAPYYNEYFDHVVYCIENGKTLDGKELVAIRKKYGPVSALGSMAFCAFS